ncbi:MAG: hypothetical protein ACREXR_05555, partial [Gammaproteobacteria bacterium]
YAADDRRKQLDAAQGKLQNHGRSNDLVLLDRYMRFYHELDKEDARLTLMSSSSHSNRQLSALSQMQTPWSEADFARNGQAALAGAGIYVQGVDSIAKKAGADFGQLSSVPGAADDAAQWRQLAQGTKLTGIGLGAAGVGAEYLTMDRSSSADVGHFTLNTGMTVLATVAPRFTPVGVAWTVVDTGVSFVDHTPVYGASAGKPVSGWSAVWAKEVDRQENTVRQTMKKYDMTEDQAKSFIFWSRK